MNNMELMDLWVVTPTPEVNSFESLPVGKYVASVDRCAMDATKKDNIPMIAWDLKIVSPEQFAGRHVFLNRVLKSQDNVKFAKLDFKKLGFKVDNFRELNLVMESLLDKLVDISVVQSKTMNQNGEYYVNTYVNKLHTPEGTSEVASSQEEVKF